MIDDFLFYYMAELKPVYEAKLTLILSFISILVAVWGRKQMAKHKHEHVSVRHFSLKLLKNKK